MLSWTKLNPIVEEIPVTKLFYNKFLFKIKIYCPGVRVLERKTIEELTNNFWRVQKDEIFVNYNYAGSWLHRRNTEIKDHGKIDQLQYFFNTKVGFQKEIKYRLEEPYLSIYGNDEQLLFNIASQTYPKRCIAIHKPKNKAAEEIILKGEIISKKINDYDYKINLKSNYFSDISIKNSLADYFYNIKDDIKITKNIMNLLASNQSWFSGGYFYAKNKDVTVFINLICPGLVTSIFKVTYLNS